MASVEDVTLSMYTKVKKIADEIGFGFVSTTSIESASSTMMDAKDKLVLVQTKIKDAIFLDAEYKIFVSFAASTDINSIKETEITSLLLASFPAFSKVCVFEASALKQVPSVYTDTGKAMVVKTVSQDIVSITQMKNNLSAIVVNLTGYIK